MQLVFANRWAGVVAASLLISNVPARAENAPRQITVTGDADVLVAPDQAVIRFGISLARPDLDDARQTADRNSARLLKEIARLGIQAKDVKTDILYIWVSHEWKREKTVTSYEVRKEVEVTLADITLIEAVLAGGLTSGANEVSMVEFRVSALRKTRDQARQLALQAAREKAETMAGTLGQKIGKPLTITEQTYPGRESFGWGWWGSRANQMAQNVIRNTSAEESGVAGETMALGQKRVNAKVIVSFELL